MTIQQPTNGRPRPNNQAPAAREDAEYRPARTIAERRAWADGYRLGRHRGRIDAWQEWTGHSIPGAEPRPPVQADPSKMVEIMDDRPKPRLPDPFREPTSIGWRDVLTKITTMLQRKAP